MVIQRGKSWLWRQVVHFRATNQSQVSKGTGDAPVSDRPVEFRQGIRLAPRTTMEHWGKLGVR